MGYKLSDEPLPPENTPIEPTTAAQYLLPFTKPMQAAEALVGVANAPGLFEMGSTAAKAVPPGMAEAAARATSPIARRVMELISRAGSRPLATAAGAAKELPKELLKAAGLAGGGYLGYKLSGKK